MARSIHQHTGAGKLEAKGAASVGPTPTPKALAGATPMQDDSVHHTASTIRHTTQSWGTGPSQRGQGDRGVNPQPEGELPIHHLTKHRGGSPPGPDLAESLPRERGFTAPPPISAEGPRPQPAHILPRPHPIPLHAGNNCLNRQQRRLSRRCFMSAVLAPRIAQCLAALGSSGWTTSRMPSWTAPPRPRQWPGCSAHGTA